MEKPSCGGYFYFVYLPLYYHYLSATFLGLLVVSLLSALIWHAYNLMKLSKWLWLDRSVLPPEGKGGWGAYFLWYTTNTAT